MKIKSKRNRAVVRCMIALTTELLHVARNEDEQIELLEIKRTLLRLVTERKGMLS